MCIPVLGNVMPLPVCLVLFSRSPTNDNEMFWLLGEAGGIVIDFCRHVSLVATVYNTWDIICIQYHRVRWV